LAACQHLAVEAGSHSHSFQMSTHTQRLATWPVPHGLPVEAGGTARCNYKRWFRLALLVSDATTLCIALLLAYWTRFNLHLSLSPEVVPSAQFYAALMAILVPIWLSLFALFGLYDWENLLAGTLEYSRAFHACTTAMMLVIVTAFVDPSFVVARGWLIPGWVYSVVLVSAARFMLRRVVYSFRRRGSFQSRAVIVGCNGEAATLARQLADSPSSGYRIVGMVIPGKAEESVTPSHEASSGLPVLGTIEQIRTVVTDLGVEEVIVAASSVDRRELLELFERTQPLNGVHLRLSTGLYEVLTTGVHVKTCASIPFISLDRLRLSPAQTLVKTSLEYCLAAAALVLLAPFLAVIAALIKFTSDGPVIHRRRVLGVGGREFDAFKFRTMFADADALRAQNDPSRTQFTVGQKLRCDPRVTPLGAFLRRFSLDELPQLVNVLLGQMSLVGPRMITRPEAERYGQYKINLLTVKPGITGLWQVSGRSDLTYEERVRLDMHYIRHYSVWLDLQILLVQTPVAVLSGRGAY